jgi:hypothetical protein
MEITMVTITDRAKKAFLDLEKKKGLVNQVLRIVKVGYG